MKPLSNIIKIPMMKNYHLLGWVQNGVAQAKEMIYKPSPGVNRDNRIADEGLQRLEKQLKNGCGISQQVLDQWIKRYGDKATAVIKKYK
jgi:hypothetical protein